MLMWKIVETGKASVLYIYIDYDLYNLFNDDDDYE